MSPEAKKLSQVYKTASNKSEVTCSEKNAVFYGKDLWTYELQSNVLEQLNFSIFLKLKF